MNPTRRSKHRLLRLSVALLVCVTIRFATADTNLNLTKLKVEPQAIKLDGRNRQQQLLVSGRSEDGTFIDVTHDCEIQILDADIASLDGSVLSCRQDGTTKLNVRFGNLEQMVPVRVESADRFAPLFFETDIVPLISKLGCNSGGCHGKQSGQNGFKLSVFGHDPAADFRAITQEARGRRIMPNSPLRSLFIQKATGEIPHGGGKRTTLVSTDVELITQWIQQGMKSTGKEAPRVAGIEVFPKERILKPLATQQLLVTAKLSDGSDRDITTDVAYASNAETIANMDKPGLLQTGPLPGEAGITISYMGHVAVAKVLIPRDKISYSDDRVPKNRIDELVWEKFAKMGIMASTDCDDATFLRRLYVDTIGTLPTSFEVESFLKNNDPNKRSQSIDKVLSREEFADYWAQRWADILLVDRKQLGERGSYQFHYWLRKQQEQNRPYDQWVRELITANGNSAKFGPVNFYRALKTPEELTRSVSQAFLGIRLDCAQCHQHPFDVWSPRDFYGMAGFFNGIERKELVQDRAVIFQRRHLPSKLPLTGDAVTTQPPNGTPMDLTDPRHDPRWQLAHWLTSEKNPWFSRLVANRIWKHFLGRGLVEPEDDLRLTNPATNEALLSYLEEQVITTNFDLQAVMRLVLNSRVYQLSSIPNASNKDDGQNFSHFTVKRLPATVLLDAISDVTGSPEVYPGMPRGTRAIQLWDNRFPSYFLDTFGRSERTSPCECGDGNSPTMSQALHLMNAPEIDAKISDPNGRAAILAKGNKSRAEIVNELCVVALGRPANAKEERVAARLFANSSKRQATEDFLWTLLNSYDFLFLH